VSSSLLMLTLLARTLFDDRSSSMPGFQKLYWSLLSSVTPRGFDVDAWSPLTLS
jgi:hypothetical protein